MFIGFIPVLFALVAALASLRNQRVARFLWLFCTLLITVWSTFHGKHHLPELLELGSW